MGLLLKPIWWMIAKIYTILSKKSVFWFGALLVFSSLDILFPQLGRKLTTTALVVGPALFLGVYIRILRFWNARADQILAVVIYIEVCGWYGLLRAWSAAAGTDVPGYVGTLSRWLFGPALNVLAGIVVTVFGVGNYAPMPVYNTEGLVAQVSALDPVLTLSSLGVVIWGANMLYSASRQWGSAPPQMTPEEKKKSRNRLIPAHRVNRRLIGRGRTFRRQIFALALRPRIGHDEFVVGMGPPVWKRPITWPVYVLGGVATGLGLRIEGSLLDTPELFIAKMKTGALIVGGAGSGKTLIQVANLILGDSPRLLVETQGNVADKEEPILAANGRRLLVIDPKRGAASASINLLERLDPDMASFPDDVQRIASYIIEAEGEHKTLKRTTFEMVACVIANVIVLARDQDMVPDLSQVYEALTLPDLAEHVEDWAVAGHPAFRQWASTVAKRLADPEFDNSLAAIWSPELSFLADPMKAATICGGTGQAFDPAQLLDDQNLDVAIQIDQQDLPAAGALLRLLMLGVMAPRIALNQEAAKRTRASGLTLYVDELAALQGARVLDDTVVFFRQKNIRFVYNMQSVTQADLNGPGTFAKWSATADIRIFAKLGEQELATLVSTELGETVRLRSTKVGGAGGGHASHSYEWKSEPLLTVEEMSCLPGLMSVVMVRTDRHGIVKILCQIPAYFRHRALGAFIARARRRFARKGDHLSLPRPKVPEVLPRPERHLDTSAIPPRGDGLTTMPGE